MNRIKELAGRLNRAQRTLRFKIVATIVVVALGIGGFSAWAVAVSAPATRDAVASIAPEQQPQAPDQAEQPGDEREDDQQAPQGRTLDAEVLRSMVGSPDAWKVVAGGTAAITALASLVIWLGLGLTYLGLIAVAGLIAGPLYLWEPTRGAAQLVGGLTALTASFTVLMQGCRAALAGDSPVLAIARNVLDEAARMKISLVFIVLLIFLLAALPGLLAEDQPLQYRVQQFLQYSVAGTFWVLALLTLFFSVASVAFEQRDRVIWQTMVKPVSPLQYLMGKWTGVMALNLALLAVSASGVFLFTEYLRNQPAQGESAPYVLESGRPGLTDDRLAVESQVLAARRAVGLGEPEISPSRLDDAVDRRMEAAMSRDPSLRERPRERERLRRDLREQLIKTAREQYRSVPPGAGRTFTFSGLAAAKERGQPLMLRYTVNAGSNNPNALYRVTFRTDGRVYPQQVGLGMAQRIPAIPPDAISEDGTLELDVVNGDPSRRLTNPLTITFPPDGLEVLYAAGAYEANFLRVVVALWVKLGFIAAVAVGASTFLSFPVACMAALLVLFAAETSNFLASSIEQFPVEQRDGGTNWVAVLIRLAASPIAWAFSAYGDLQPTTKLVSGRLIGWGELTKGVAVIAAWTIAALGLGWSIFRKRELAIYSGH